MILFSRGCIPPLWGSGIFRSTQFAVFEAVYTYCDKSPFLKSEIPGTFGLQPYAFTYLQFLLIPNVYLVRYKVITKFSFCTVKPSLPCLYLLSSGPTINCLLHHKLLILHKVDSRHEISYLSISCASLFTDLSLAFNLLIELLLLPICTQSFNSFTFIFHEIYNKLYSQESDRRRCFRLHCKSYNRNTFRTC